MAHFEDKNNEIILIDDYFDLKITSDRQIFIKLKNSSSFKLLTNDKTPLGFSSAEKKKALTVIAERLKAEKSDKIEASMGGNNK